MLKHEEILKLHDKAYVHGQEVRERAANDLVFYAVTQWDDDILQESDLDYRGEFDILRKSIRQIMGDLRGNEIQIDFKPDDETSDDDAELMDGLYRTSSRKNISIESYDNAKLESVVSGMGAWELFTEYKSNRNGDRKQVINRRPLFEANNQLFWDPNAKLIDKSDAKYCSSLVAYSEDGYKDLVFELTGQEVDDVNPQSFSYPEHSYTFLWLSDDRKFYVSSFYHLEIKKEKLIFLKDFMGAESRMMEQEFKAQMDDLIDNGYEVVSEKEVERPKVTKYIVSGEGILKTYDIPCEYIPIVPMYGERIFVEGVEIYEGVVKLAKDPQRLRNFQMSYLASIVSESPRNKPVFYDEQIDGYEYLYEKGSDGNYPYYKVRRLDSNGNELPLSVGELPEQKVPQSLIASINLSREAVEDVANPGTNAEMDDVNLSGKAVQAIQRRLDEQSVIYQQNFKMALRRDGQVFASMSGRVMDSQRREMVTKKDDQTEYVDLMAPSIDENTGEFLTKYDLTAASFDVWADIGPSYNTQIDQTLDQMGLMLQGMPPQDPMSNIIRLKMFKLMRGVDLDDIREYANRQLMLLGLREPETEEDQQFMAQQAQQGQEPSAEMVLALAEDKKGQAALMREEREAFKAQTDARDDAAQTEIDRFNAQTKRMDTQVAATKAGAEVANKQADTLNKRIDAAQKRAEAQAQRIQGMDNDELIRTATQQR